MARVVLVHGIGQQYLGRWSLHGAMAGALVDGVELAGGKGELTPDQVDVAFYGNLFRPVGMRGDSEPKRAADIVDDFEIELLYAWWAAAAAAEPGQVVHPEASGLRAPTPVTAQRAVNALLRSRCVSGAMAERFLLGSLRQVRWYLTVDSVREAALEAIAKRIGPDTRVLVGHSLGSVVAYEALRESGMARARASHLGLAARDAEADFRSAPPTACGRPGRMASQRRYLAQPLRSS
jgi:hypothetical protein